MWKTSNGAGNCIAGEAVSQDVWTAAPWEDQTEYQDNTPHGAAPLLIPYSHSAEGRTCTQSCYCSQSFFLIRLKKKKKKFCQISLFKSFYEFLLGDRIQEQFEVKKTFSFKPHIWIKTKDWHFRFLALARAASVCLCVGIRAESDWWKARSTESRELRAVDKHPLGTAQRCRELEMRRNVPHVSKTRSIRSKGSTEIPFT